MSRSLTYFVGILAAVALVAAAFATGNGFHESALIYFIAGVLLGAASAALAATNIIQTSLNNAKHLKGF